MSEGDLRSQHLGEVIGGFHRVLIAEGFRLGKQAHLLELFGLRLHAVDIIIIGEEIFKLCLKPAHGGIPLLILRNVKPVWVLPDGFKHLLLEGHRAGQALLPGQGRKLLHRLVIGIGVGAKVTLRVGLLVEEEEAIDDQQGNQRAQECLSQ